MIIVSASDNNFVPGLLILIYSAWINNPTARFYIIDAGISEEGRTRLSAFSARHGISCGFLRADPTLLARLPKPASWSSATYARLLIPDLLPEESRAIYIDGDAVVNSDISELWTLDLGDKLVAGVLDGMMNPAFLVEIDSGADQYINAGVLVMNLDLWRSEGVGAQSIAQLMTHPDLGYADQTAINIVAKDRINYIDRKFNFFAREYTRFKKKIPRIIHYPGPDKPWQNMRSPLSEIYNAYRDVSGADIPEPPSGWEFKTFRRTLVGLLSLRPKYWRQLNYKYYYQSRFIEPHICELRAKVAALHSADASTAESARR